MSKTFELPDPGEGIHEAEVVELHVSQGDEVDESDILLDVETDKAVVEIPAPFTGRIEQVLVDVGDDIRVGDAVLEYEDSETGEETESTSAEDDATQAADPGAEEAAAEGDTEPSMEEEEAGPSTPQEAEAAGDEPSSGADAEGADGTGGRGSPVPAAPATRRLARELNVDLEEVQASGPEGRVTPEDVRRAAGGEGAAEDEGPAEDEQEEEPAEGGGTAEDEQAEGAEAEAAGVETEEAGAQAERGEPTEEESREAAPPGIRQATEYEAPETWGEVQREPLRSVRRTTARRMAEAWRRIPHVTHVDHADITELEAFRSEHDEALDDADLTLTVFLVKALVAVLKEYPRFNARLDEESEEIAYLQYHHVGVAVDTDRGLLVPVLRDADAKSLKELAVELRDLTEAARERGITRDQMRGGTFTLTNPGPLGGDVVTPVINPPQVAILGVGRARKRPVVVEDGAEDGIEVRLVLPLCLSFDHRVNDGADAARFVTRLVEVLEDPGAFVRHL